MKNCKIKIFNSPDVVLQLKCIGLLHLSKLYRKKFEYYFNLLKK